MKCELKDGELIIRLPAETVNPRVSASGKTRLVASERDKGTLQVGGKDVTVQVNAYVKA